MSAASANQISIDLGSPQRDHARTECTNRYARTPGRIERLHARATSSTEIVLSFAAPGTEAYLPTPGPRLLRKAVACADPQRP